MYKHPQHQLNIDNYLWQETIVLYSGITITVRRYATKFVTRVRINSTGSETTFSKRTPERMSRIAELNKVAASMGFEHRKFIPYGQFKDSRGKKIAPVKY